MLVATSTIMVYCPCTMLLYCPHTLTCRYTLVVSATYSGPLSRPSILKHATPALIRSGTSSTAIRS